MDRRVIAIGLRIIIILIAAGFFLFNKQNGISKIISSHGKYDCRKVSRFIGFGLLGIAISCLPSLLSVIFHIQWLNVFTILLFLIETILLAVYESKGKLK